MNTVYAEIIFVLDIQLVYYHVTEKEFCNIQGLIFCI